MDLSVDFYLKVTSLYLMFSVTNNQCQHTLLVIRV